MGGTVVINKATIDNIERIPNTWKAKQDWMNLIELYAFMGIGIIDQTNT